VKDRKPFLQTKKEREDHYQEVLVKDIPVCTAMIWNYLETEPFDWCGYLWCCYHCPKARTICKDNGCASSIATDYPFKCRCYPMTFEEGKAIWEKEKKKYATAKIGDWNFIKFSKACDEFINQVGKDRKMQMDRVS